MAYKSTPDGKGWLVFYLKPYKKINGIKEEEKAFLYGPDLPSWVPGLIAAGRVKTAEGEINSPGAAYHRLVKGKYQGQTVKGKENVEQLREMMS